jgi:hypothetical protein
MFALIFKNKVVDIANQTFPVIPTMEWIECNSSVKIGWLFVDEIFKESNLSDFEILKNAKNQKIAQLKANRISEMEVETPKPSSSEVYQIDGVARIFKLKISDIAILNSRIIRLQNAIAGTTAQWTDIDNNRLDLTLEQFRTLANHLDVRDQNLFTLYTEKLAEINACTTLEELKAININFE